MVGVQVRGRGDGGHLQYGDVGRVIMIVVILQQRHPASGSIHILVIVLVPHESAQGLPIGHEQQPQHHADREQDDEGSPAAQRGLASLQNIKYY